MEAAMLEAPKRLGTCPHAALTGLRRHIAREALYLRDWVRESPVPLPAAAAGASLLTLVIHIVAP
jgi:hypothetical protein